MPRQTSVQLTPATDRQVQDLQEHGFGTFTDIVRISIDRMHKEEMVSIVRVSSRKQMMRAIRAAGGTPTPIPQNDVTLGNTTIIRDVRETSFRGCNHDVSTDRFSGERDWCEVCQAMRTVR